jgi:alpha 1,2-mannosyltransferase
MNRCLHLGHVLEPTNFDGGPSWLRQCSKHGECRTSVILNNDGRACCDRCPDYANSGQPVQNGQPEKYRRVTPLAEVRQAPCVHRGEQTREQGCASCGGNVRVKVFACNEHGECTVAKELPGTQCCQTCPDYAKESLPSGKTHVKSSNIPTVLQPASQSTKLLLSAELREVPGMTATVQPISTGPNGRVGHAVMPEPRQIPMLKPEQVTIKTPVPQLKEVLRHGPPGPWAEGWAKWPNVITAHRELCDEVARTTVTYPGGFEGRGIVSCVSAKPGLSSGKNLSHGYMPGAWVMVKELRRLGCKLPITFCNLGASEWDGFLTELVRSLGVTVVDLKEWEAQPGNKFNCMHGFECKLAGVLASPYEEVMYLDADNIPLRDPTFLFNSSEFKDKGAIFWPDLPPSGQQGLDKEWLPPPVWESIGLQYNKEVVDAESGQYLVSKAKLWPELMLCKWLNEHSTYFFSSVFGDKSLLVLAWQKLAQVLHGQVFGTTPGNYAMPTKPAGWNGGAILQHDFSGAVLFEHCVRNKPSLDAFPHGRDCLTHADHCIRHLAELKQKWSGKLWSTPVPSAVDAATTASLLHKTFLYRRLLDEPDEREIRFLEDNRIGKGGARCEFGWSVIGGVLAVSDCDGAVTFLARKGGDGVWRGRWESHEKCEVELVPT